MKPWIRKLWHLQPSWLRRLELQLVADYLVAPLPRSRPLQPGPVIVAGFLGTASGLGEGARQMVQRFRDQGLKVHTANFSRFAVMEDFDAGPLWPENVGNGGIIILHINPDIFNLAFAALGPARLRQRKIVGYWAWELDRVPSSWVKMLDRVDEVWVPSRFIAEALKKASTKKPIHVVPQPLNLNHEPTAPACDPFPEFKGRPLVFFSYDIRSTHARKNPEAVIEAFRRATQGNPDPVLVIKAHPEKAWPESVRRLREAAAGHDNIHLLTTTLAPEDMKNLMARVDVVISLHRSEGFGFLMAEAMAASKPVIATGWSGNLDFMTPESSILIGSKLIPVVDPQGAYDRYNASWADPDIEQAAEALRRLLNDPTERRRLGQAARAHILAWGAPEAWMAQLPDSFWAAVAQQGEGLSSPPVFRPLAPSPASTIGAQAFE